jgi:1-aminocyclopropane-1-carboxylate deaminase/D-cysteine desulfhydrase-like pyridoxal-dependent ACC family enzyme
MPFNIFNASLQVLSDPSFQQKKITLSVLRLDKIHPEVSGNK